MDERSLQEILRLDLWEKLEKAAKGENPTWKTAWVASQCRSGLPALRIMVLRAVNRAERELIFFTDTRSPKWGQLGEQERGVEVGFWSPEDQVQLRCRGQVTLHEGDSVAKAFRAELSARNAGDYTAIQAPGSEIATFSEGQRTGSEWYFGVIRVQIVSFDWLRLDRAGHRRARFDWEKGDCEMSWIQP